MLLCTLSIETGKGAHAHVQGRDRPIAAMPRTMIIIEGLSNVPPEARGASLAIGNFDGVHRGHQALLQAAKDAAVSSGGKAGVILFEPNPREFFQPDKPHFRLTPLPRKLELLGEFGLDLAVVLPFDAALAELSADAFIEQVLVQGLGASHVVIGYDFRFGKGRAGDPEMLRRAGAAQGFGVTVVAQVAGGGEVFSSSAIRAELAQGDVGRRRPRCWATTGASPAR